MSIQATFALREKAAQLLAADAATLAPAVNENIITLLMADFVPSENTVLGDLTPSTFDGDTPLDCGVGTQPEGTDPNTGDAIITLLSPAGGWRWETTGTTNLPQTIFGYMLTDSTGATLLGCAKLAEPIELTAAGQVVQLEEVYFRQLAGSIG